MVTLRKIWELSNVPLFDMDAPGFNQLARIERYDNDIRNVPGYINSDVMLKYQDSEVDEISWHNDGIAVKFYKGDEDEE